MGTTPRARVELSSCPVSYLKARARARARELRRGSEPRRCARGGLGLELEELEELEEIEEIGAAASRGRELATASRLAWIGAA
jgi:hypothetical protein